MVPSLGSLCPVGCWQFRGSRFSRFRQLKSAERTAFSWVLPSRRAHAFALSPAGALLRARSKPREERGWLWGRSGPPPRGSSTPLRFRRSSGRSDCPWTEVDNLDPWAAVPPGAEYYLHSYLDAVLYGHSQQARIPVFSQKTGGAKWNSRTSGITGSGRIMSTSNEQSAILPLNAPTKPPEVFGPPPSATDLDSLTDGRDEGAFVTKYSAGTWVQIVVELVYLVGMLVYALAALGLLAKFAVFKDQSGLVFNLFGPAERSKILQLYATIALSGVCGGCSSSLKWLYHSVAKRRWHRDRVVWQFTVPLLSGTLAVFTGMMIVSGLVPFLARSWLTGLTAAAAFGFFVGLYFPIICWPRSRELLSTFLVR